MIFHIPHASTEIPPEQISALLPDDAQLAAELLAMTDAFTDDLFSKCPVDGDAFIRFPISRLIVDPERFENEADEIMAKVGMGVIYEKTSDGRPLRPKPSAEERETLLEKYYRPHHEALSAAVARELTEHGESLIIDCHSFPSTPLRYELDQNPDRPDICVGADEFHTPELLVEMVTSFAIASGYTVDVNAPFAGTLVPVPFYRENGDVASIMIEVNRRLYMDEATGRKNRRFDDIQEFITQLVSILRSVFLRYDE